MAEPGHDGEAQERGAVGGVAAQPLGPGGADGGGAVALDGETGAQGDGARVFFGLRQGPG